MDARRATDDLGIAIHYDAYGGRYYQDLLGDMMVSKIVVVALVAIVACPILMGYAMNLTETTGTAYKVTGESVNVTPILKNGTQYSYANSDIYQLNTNTGVMGFKIYPVYNSVLYGTKTSLKGQVDAVSGTTIITSGSGVVSQYSYLNYLATYIPSQGSVTITYVTTDNITHTQTNFHSLNYNASNATTIISYYTSDTTIGTIGVDLLNVLGFSKTGSYDGYMYVDYDYIAGNSYIDMAAGFKLIDQCLVSGGGAVNIFMPTDTRSALMTINLDSITDSSYHIYFDNFRLDKTTTAGVVSWTVTNVRDSSVTDLYYDPDINDNTYQFYEEVEYESPHKTHSEFRYIGHWPTLIGEANYYQIYSFDFPDRLYFSTISFSYSSAIYTPTIRMDDALFRAFEYQTITDKTYDPAAFRSNPITTISNPSIYGSSLSFGGNTYTVTDGNISLGGHDVPVKGLTFSSVNNGAGSYDNKIGNTIVSTTPQPSTITFNGTWSASISTQAMEQYTYTKTEWTPGHFGWDGLDQNFLMVGLLTSIGVFIALGLYVRRTRSSLWPLLVVCGGAVMVFFIML